MSKNLSEIFSQYKDKKFIFVQPGGNWGDHLIYFGAEHLAEQLGVDFSTKTKEEFLALDDITDQVIYIHGGGAFNSWCSDSGFRLLTAALKKNNNIVIYGPASCGDVPEFLAEQFSNCFKVNNAKKCYMFAREQKTFDMFSNIDSIVDNATLLKDVDTAFQLSKEAVIKRVGEEKFLYDFYAFREDNEACDTEHEFSYSSVVFDPPLWCESFDHWLKVHLYATKIITNRTHSSVIGSILEKPTYLFSGSYHKNKSIWLETLQDKNVKWLGSEEAIGLVPKNLLDKLLPSVVKKSWKIKAAYLKWKKVP